MVRVHNFFTAILKESVEGALSKYNVSSAGPRCWVRIKTSVPVALVLRHLMKQSSSGNKNSPGFCQKDGRMRSSTKDLAQTLQSVSAVFAGAEGG